jgi:bacillithiol system protein YtxJ
MMFWSTQKEIPANWKRLEDNVDVANLLSRSEEKPLLLFKHSTRCSISAFALNRLSEGSDALTAEMDVYYLDLIRYRATSDALASQLEVTHQSPQIILVSKGHVLGSLSHEQVSPEAVLDLLRR